MKVPQRAVAYPNFPRSDFAARGLLAVSLNGLRDAGTHRMHASHSYCASTYYCILIQKLNQHGHAATCFQDSPRPQCGIHRMDGMPPRASPAGPNGSIRRRTVVLRARAWGTARSYTASMSWTRSALACSTTDSVSTTSMPRYVAGRGTFRRWMAAPAGGSTSPFLLPVIVVRLPFGYSAMKKTAHGEPLPASVAATLVLLKAARWR